MILNDYQIIHELSTYVADGSTYNAEDGYHDDLVMCLVLFAWLSSQSYFKDMTNTDIRSRIMQDQEDNFTPFGIIDDGRDDEQVKVMNDAEFANFLLN